MNRGLATAAILATLLAAAHSYLGERYILIRLFRRDDLPKLFGGTTFTKETLRFAWHITSVMALGIAALLLGLARPEGADAQTQARIIAATLAACGVVALIGSRGRHLSWIVFFAAGALAFWA
jgi:hypothetical protein